MFHKIKHFLCYEQMFIIFALIKLFIHVTTAKTHSKSNASSGLQGI